MSEVRINRETLEIEIDAEKFAEWMLKNERVVEDALAGHPTLDPLALYITASMRGKQIASIGLETGVVCFKPDSSGEYFTLPDWTVNFESALVWRCGGREKPVRSVDVALEALADALWLECVKATVRKQLKSKS